MLGMIHADPPPPPVFNGPSMADIASMSAPPSSGSTSTSHSTPTHAPSAPVGLPLSAAGGQQQQQKSSTSGQISRGIVKQVGLCRVVFFDQRGTTSGRRWKIKGVRLSEEAGNEVKCRRSTSRRRDIVS